MNTEATTPYWSTIDSLPEFAPLTGRAQADVVVIGGGITGLTTAYLLAKAGVSVVVLERARCASVDTGHTSAHLTMVTDTRLSMLVQQFGRSHAQAVWDAGRTAVMQIDEIVRGEQLSSAGFAWVDGYLHAPLGEGHDTRSDFEDDATMASELGFETEFLDAVPLASTPGVRFPEQARIHPRRYLAGVASAIVALGGRIFEHSAADDFIEDPRRVVANGHEVGCESVVIATHTPLVGFQGMAGASLFQTKLALYTSYVVAGRIGKGIVPDALWWDTADPYHYIRVEPNRDHDLVICGGLDHKTGQQADTMDCYRKLEAHLIALIPDISITHRWSGQVIETPDGLPYIGETAERQYAATGYAGNGLTFGTLAAMMMSDAVLGRRNPWIDLFHPSRKALTHGLKDYLKENVDYPYYLIRDRLGRDATRSLQTIEPGQGAVVTYQGKKIAAYRDENGHLTTRSATCTHMGCLVAWNPAERTWDCPCHGSRFTVEGDVIAGPAESPLESVDLTT